MPRYIIQRGCFNDGETVHRAGEKIDLPKDVGDRHVATGDLAPAPARKAPAKKTAGDDTPPAAPDGGAA